MKLEISSLRFVVAVAVVVAVVIIIIIINKDCIFLTYLCRVRTSILTTKNGASGKRKDLRLSTDI